MVKLINVKNKESYYEKLKIGITMSSMWNSLQTKCEYGLSKSERGYQSIASIMAGNIADGLDVDRNLVECLTMCYASFFPAYGEAGKKVIMDYLIDNDIFVKENELAKDYVEYELFNAGNIISPEFDQLLKCLFSDKSINDPIEVQIARVCVYTLNVIKNFEVYGSINDVDLLFYLTKEVEKDCINNGKVIVNKKVKEIDDLIANKESVLPDEIKQAICNTLNEFIEYEKDKMIGIYEYIGMNQL